MRINTIFMLFLCSFILENMILGRTPKIMMLSIIVKPVNLLTYNAYGESDIL